MGSMHFLAEIHNPSDWTPASQQTQGSAMITLTIILSDSDPRRDSRRQFTVEGGGSLTYSWRFPETDPMTAFPEDTHSPLWL